MAVAFDAKATTVTQQLAYSSPVTNTTLTIGGTGTLIIGAFIAFDATTLATPTAMTWNGVTMTQIGTKASSDGFASVTLFALVAPATGNHTLSCTYTNGSGGSPGTYLDCWSFSGTDTSSVANCIPAGNVITDATTATATLYPSSAITVTTASGDAACAAAASFFAVIDSAAVGTAINVDDAGGGNYTSLYNLAVGATTNAQFGTGGGVNPAAGVFFRIKQPGGAVVPVLQQARRVFLRRKRPDFSGWNPLSDPRNRPWRSSRGLILPERKLIVPRKMG